MTIDEVGEDFDSDSLDSASVSIELLELMIVIKAQLADNKSDSRRQTNRLEKLFNDKVNELEEITERMNNTAAEMQHYLEATKSENNAHATNIEKWSMGVDKLVGDNIKESKEKARAQDNQLSAMEGTIQNFIDETYQRTLRTDQKVDSKTSKVSEKIDSQTERLDKKLDEKFTEILKKLDQFVTKEQLEKEKALIKTQEDLREQKSKSALIKEEAKELESNEDRAKLVLSLFLQFLGKTTWQTWLIWFGFSFLVSLLIGYATGHVDKAFFEALGSLFQSIRGGE